MRPVFEARGKRGTYPRLDLNPTDPVHIFQHIAMKFGKQLQAQRAQLRAPLAAACLDYKVRTPGSSTRELGAG